MLNHGCLVKNTTKTVISRGKKTFKTTKTGCNTCDGNMVVVVFQVSLINRKFKRTAFI